MTAGLELATLLRRDILKLAQQLEQTPSEEVLWGTLPGVSNSIGNLAMHLEGNLREYIGRQLGGIAYQRDRPAEFAGNEATRKELAARIRDLAETIPAVARGLSEERLGELFPEETLGLPMSNLQFLVHLHGHLNYHLGQIDYLRRVLIGGGAIEYVQLEYRER